MNSDAAPRIRAVSFNLKFAEYEPPNSWHERRPVVREWRRRYDPDIVGTQEGVYRQLRDMAADMPEYEWIGTGRSGGSRGEFMAVFFKRDRFEPLEFDHYWLSDTPNVVGSSSWGNSVKRMVTWIRFMDKAADREFYVVNTHFDHVVEKARVLSAELVASRCAELNSNLPVVLLGDFNAAAERSRPYAILTEKAGFRDAALESGVDIPNIATYHGWRGPREGARIDWILLRGGLEAVSYETHLFEMDGQYPSDHFPIAAELEWRP